MIENKIMKINKKGFTLVEIIVVLVILAVLAAVTIPSMLGFVEEAKAKAEIANARAAYLATQMYVTESWAKDSSQGRPLVEAVFEIKEDHDWGAGKLLKQDMTGAKLTYKYEKGKVLALHFYNNGILVKMTDLGTNKSTVTAKRAEMEYIK